ncbi:hypothetical protein [Mesorhizobium sp.]|uniref:hypothetical protein n=1 Tax=Mesorhizobium sp. TaxID=1871066 RepID=UPI0025F0EB9D|nr:hypothetical protein [Mesorhizobium sp.]
MAFVKGQRYIDRMAKGWTLQSLIDGKMRLVAFCHNPKCRHNQALDLEALKAMLGPDAPAMSDDLIPKLKCARCGGQAGWPDLHSRLRRDETRGRECLSEGEGRALTAPRKRPDTSRKRSVSGGIAGHKRHKKARKCAIPAVLTLVYTEDVGGSSPSSPTIPY